MTGLLTLAIGLVLGAACCATALWARTVARRAADALALAQAVTTAAEALSGAQERHDRLLYNHDADLDTAAQRGGWARRDP